MLKPEQERCCKGLEIPWKNITAMHHHPYLFTMISFQTLVVLFLNKNWLSRKNEGNFIGHFHNYALGEASTLR